MTPTRDELLKLAKKVGASALHDGEYALMGDDKIERFAALLCAHQAQAEPPMGWVTEDYLTDKSATTYDSTIAARWRTKGWPVKPIYTAPPSSDQTWNEAIEAAKKRILDERVDAESTQTDGDEAYNLAIVHCFDALNSILKPSQAQEQDCESCEGKGHFDERLGGYAFSNPKAKCPDCDGKGWWIPSVEQPVSGAVDEREAFEKWIVIHCGAYNWKGDGVLPRSEDGRYTWSVVQENWAAWQARAALSRAQQAPAVSDPCGLDGNRPIPFSREELGRMVRQAWVTWAQSQPNPKASWLLPYDQLNEADKEADRQIGEFVARWVLIGDSASRVFLSQPAAAPVSEQTTQEKS